MKGTKKRKKERERERKAKRMKTQKRRNYNLQMKGIEQDRGMENQKQNGKQEL